METHAQLKTQLAKALCHQACRKHLTVVFYNFHRFFNELNKAAFKDQLSKLIKHLTKVDLLTIDDFGFKKISQPFPIP